MWLPEGADLCCGTTSFWLDRPFLTTEGGGLLSGRVLSPPLLLEGLWLLETRFVSDELYPDRSRDLEKRFDK